ncbi:MAG: ATP-dependent helicase [Firmicutes bacterium]|nr:ATP-dependent helicase [Bacillota bacterium]
MSNLNVQQMEAVRHMDGPMLVLAGPGSGKTTMITHRVLYMQDEGRIPEKQILVVTYTKAAAQEMCSRFLRLKGTDLTEVTFGTFHSIFWRMLRQQGHFSDRKVMEEGQDLQIGTDLLMREWEMPSSEAKELAQEYLNLYSRERNGLKVTFQDQYKRWKGLYEEEKQVRKLIDFDDMQEGAVQMLNDSGVRSYYQERFRYILVDEFQDVNPIQYQALRMLTGTPANIFVVGDDDQAIYGFRGAAPGIMQQFPKDFPGCQILNLKNNYRSTQRIVHFAGQIIACNQVRYSKEIVAASGETGRKVQCREFENEKEECRAIAEYALKLPQWSDLAVLFRTAHEGDTLRRVLGDYNIPYYMKEECLSPYEHWIGEDIVDFLSAARGNTDALGRILKKPSRGIPLGILSWLRAGESPKRLLNFNMSPEIRLALEELFYDLGKLLKERPEKGMHRIARRLRYLEYLRGVAERSGIPERKLLQRFDFWQRDAEKVKSWEEWAQRRQRMIEGGSQIREGVQLMTLHASKGLEFPAVWIPELEEGSLPHERAENIEEERRLFYVGCTRAEKQLIISWCHKRGGGKRKKSQLLVTESHS